MNLTSSVMFLYTRRPARRARPWEHKKTGFSGISLLKYQVFKRPEWKARPRCQHCTVWISELVKKLVKTGAMCKSEWHVYLIFRETDPENVTSSVLVCVSPKMDAQRLAVIISLALLTLGKFKLVSAQSNLWDPFLARLLLPSSRAMMGQLLVFASHLNFDKEISWDIFLLYIASSDWQHLTEKALCSGSYFCWRNYSLQLKPCKCHWWSVSWNAKLEGWDAIPTSGCAPGNSRSRCIVSFTCSQSVGFWRPTRHSMPILFWSKCDERREGFPCNTASRPPPPSRQKSTRCRQAVLIQTLVVCF